MSSSRAALLCVAFALTGACAIDPVHDRAVERLGDESARGADEFHRAGQPCATCHNAKNGPAHSDFSAAGTVVAARTSLVGIGGVRVELVDSAGTSPPPVTTNCVGNFWIPRQSWDPILPIVSVRLTKGPSTRPMKTPIGGAASCADCHQPSLVAEDPLSKVSAVYLDDKLAAGLDPADPACPVNPALVKP